MSQPTSPWRGFAFISVAIFIASLDLFIVNIAFPAIGEDFPEASVSGLSWILSAYAIVFAALLVPLGKLGDLVGRLRVFRAGLAVFTLGIRAVRARAVGRAARRGARRPGGGRGGDHADVAGARPPQLPAGAPLGRHRRMGRAGRRRRRHGPAARGPARRAELALDLRHQRAAGAAVPRVRRPVLHGDPRPVRAPPRRHRRRARRGVRRAAGARDRAGAGLGLGLAGPGVPGRRGRRSARCSSRGPGATSSRSWRSTSCARRRSRSRASRRSCSSPASPGCCSATSSSSPACGATRRCRRVWRSRRGRCSPRPPRRCPVASPTASGRPRCSACPAASSSRSAPRSTCDSRPTRTT